MSIIIHTLAPTELAVLAPTESSCMRLNTVRLGFGRTHPEECCYAVTDPRAQSGGRCHKCLFTKPALPDKGAWH